MELDFLNTRELADKGAELHLKHPALGHLMYSGEGADFLGRLEDELLPHKKVIAVVRGAESDYVKKQIRAISRKKIEAKKEDDAELDESEYEIVASLIVEFKNLFVNKKPLGNTKEDKLLFLRQSQGLVDQILQFSENRSNFFKRDEPTSS